LRKAECKGTIRVFDIERKCLNFSYKFKPRVPRELCFEVN